MDFIEFHPDVTFFVGENGAGKSTLIEAIAVAMGLNAEGAIRIRALLPSKHILS
ncbi:AAA family ATPase [Photobacterium leiognathi]|uniref:AAA family ATPase n=1 Tax=Photobacterium leiognathi TaxID=553611 RepID=UPI002982B7A2|nr:AAA family ATPase [Photobacterium leiognathi]